MTQINVDLVVDEETKTIDPETGDILTTTTYKPVTPDPVGKRRTMQNILDDRQTLANQIVDINAADARYVQEWNDNIALGAVDPRI